jgi:hypothetical protein
MSTINGVALATISDVADPLAKGRVLIRLSSVTSRGTEWAPVVSAIGPGAQLKANDEVLVAFENGDPARPYVIGMLWQGNSPPPEQAGKQAVQLPTGATLHPIAGGTSGSGVCATTADLQRQVAPWLASTECLIKVLALLKPLIDIVKSLPSPPPSSLQEFAKAAAAIQPCLLMNTPAGAPASGEGSAVSHFAVADVPGRVAAFRAGTGRSGNSRSFGSWRRLLRDGGLVADTAVCVEQSWWAFGGYQCCAGGCRCTRRVCVVSVPRGA